jgi:hypothetical protein
MARISGIMLNLAPDALDVSIESAGVEELLIPPEGVNAFVSRDNDPSATHQEPEKVEFLSR